MKKTLNQIRVVYDEPISIFSDNKSAIKISNNLVTHLRIKHNLIWYHFFIDKVVENEVKLECFPIKDHVADIFTKALCKDTFEYIREKLGIITPPYLN